MDGIDGMDGINGMNGMGSYPLDCHFTTRRLGVLIKYCMFTTNGSKRTKMFDCVEQQHKDTDRDAFTSRVCTSGC